MDKLSFQTEYTSVKVPKILASRIMLTAREEGYRSVSEFLLDAGRRRLEDIDRRKSVQS